MTTRPASPPDEKQKAIAIRLVSRAWMEYGQQLRESSLAPFLHWLIKMRVISRCGSDSLMGCGPL